MRDLNEVTLSGNVGREPELKYSGAGTAILSFSVATNRNFQKNGEWQTETEWHNVVLFGDAAERTAQQLQKGTRVLVRGALKTRTYEKDGQKHYRTDILAQWASPQTKSAQVMSAEEGSIDPDTLDF